MNTFGGECLQRMMSAAFAAVEREKARINALNVFPVPDGDTGTNMALTLKAAVEGPKNASLKEYARMIAELSLRGARGNSGTILSQFFQGFWIGVRDMDEAGPTELAHALEEAANTAYRAVAVPQEGTMLTVGRVAAEAAMAAAISGGNVDDVFAAWLRGARQALRSTPDLLPLLKEAGVVDAGGEGLVVAADAALHALRAGDAYIPEVSTSRDSDGLATYPESHSAIHATDINFKYCTEFLVVGTHIDLESLRSGLEPLGDSLMVVGSPNLAKVHVHTDHPGQALEIGSRWGDLSTINIENMQEQNREYVASTISSPIAPIKDAINGAKSDVAVVAVAFGNGFQAIMDSMGVHEVVSATTLLKPSAGQLHEAIERAGAEQIILLPSHKDVVLAARQAAKLSDKQVEVLEAVSPPATIHALLKFDPSRDLEGNVHRMSEELTGLVVAEVSQATRDTTFQGVDIREGDYFALAANEIVAADMNLFQVLRSTLEALNPEEGSLITMYYGQSVSSEQAEEHMDALQDKFGLKWEFEAYSGGQSSYDYWISIE